MTQILHLTHYQNLSSILASDGLIANSDLIANGTKYTKIAYTNIQDKRSQTRVPVASSCQFLCAILFCTPITDAVHIKFGQCSWIF